MTSTKRNKFLTITPVAFAIGMVYTVLGPLTQEPTTKEVKQTSLERAVCTAEAYQAEVGQDFDVSDWWAGETGIPGNSSRALYPGPLDDGNVIFKKTNPSFDGIPRPNKEYILLDLNKDGKVYGGKNPAIILRQKVNPLLTEKGCDYKIGEQYVR